MTRGQPPIHARKAPALRRRVSPPRPFLFSSPSEQLSPSPQQPLTSQLETSLVALSECGAADSAEVMLEFMSTHQQTQSNPRALSLLAEAYIACGEYRHALVLKQ